MLNSICERAVTSRKIPLKGEIH